MEKIAVIDGDSICYICSKDTIQESLNNVDALMHSIKKGSKCDKYFLFLSKGKYFRHSINPDYKGNRKSKSELKYLKTIASYLKEQYGGVSYENLEADDLSAYAMTKLKSGYGSSIKVVNCSPDKDVVKSIPGEYFDYKYHKHGYTNAEDAVRFIFKQALMGDFTDNIKGIPGIGEKKAERILEHCKTPEQLLEATLKAYKDHYSKVGKSIYEFQFNFRQVYLLRTEDDFLQEVGYVPELPEPIDFY